MRPNKFVGTLTTMLNFAIRRPPTGVPGEGARASFNPNVLAQYSGGPNPETWHLFNNLTV